MSATLGSPTSTGWKRRSSAASFSMCLRYSSSVVAPTARSSPRASIGFSRLAASTAPSAAPAPTIVCSSSMNRMMRPVGLADLGQHRLQPLLELAAVLGAGQQRAHVQRPHAAVLQALGHVTRGDALGQALDDRGLADAGLADQHRVVLGAAGEHLDHPAHLLVAPDHRIELAALGQLGEVAAELLERRVVALGVGRGGALAAAHVGQRPSAAPRGRGRRPRTAPAAGARRPRTRPSGPRPRRRPPPARPAASGWPGAGRSRPPSAAAATAAPPAARAGRPGSRRPSPGCAAPRRPPGRRAPPAGARA